MPALFVVKIEERFDFLLERVVAGTDLRQKRTPVFWRPFERGNEHVLRALVERRHLRGYPSWRFRDRNRLLLTGEYRWTAGSFVDMALFLDGGQVAGRLEELDANRFKKTYGIGASFHTLTSTVMRVELARTPDGNSVLFSFGPSF
jgi:hypothetical protein